MRAFIYYSAADWAFSPFDFGGLPGPRFPARLAAGLPGPRFPAGLPAPRFPAGLPGPRPVPAGLPRRLAAGLPGLRFPGGLPGPRPLPAGRPGLLLPAGRPGPRLPAGLPGPLPEAEEVRILASEDSCDWMFLNESTNSAMPSTNALRFFGLAI